MQTKNSILAWSDKELSSFKKFLISEMDKENSVFAGHRDRGDALLKSGADELELQLTKAEMLASELRYKKLYKEFKVISDEVWRRIENSDEYLSDI